MTYYNQCRNCGKDSGCIIVRYKRTKLIPRCIMCGKRVGPKNLKKAGDKE